MHHIRISTITVTSMTAAPVCNDNDVRLVGTETLTQGRLEVCFFGVWDSVCDDQWTDKSSEVVCRQLGYENSGKRHYIVKFDVTVAS